MLGFAPLTPTYGPFPPQHLIHPRKCSSRIRNRFPVFFLASYPLKRKAGSKNSFSADLCVLWASAVKKEKIATAEAQSTQRSAEKKRNQSVNRNTRQRSDLVVALATLRKYCRRRSQDPSLRFGMTEICHFERGEKSSVLMKFQTQNGLIAEVIHVTVIP